MWHFKKFPQGDLRLKNEDLNREALETRNENARGYIRKSSNKSRRKTDHNPSFQKQLLMT